MSNKRNILLITLSYSQVDFIDVNKYLDKYHSEASKIGSNPRGNNNLNCNNLNLYYKPSKNMSNFRVILITLVLLPN